MSERVRTITMVVSIPTEDYDEMLPELVAGVERAARDQGIAYQTPEVSA